jgi:hypothetical protein
LRILTRSCLERFEEVGRIATEPFGRLTRAATREVRAEAEALAAFHA